VPLISGLGVGGRENEPPAPRLTRLPLSRSARRLSRKCRCSHDALRQSVNGHAASVGDRHQQLQCNGWADVETLHQHSGCTRNQTASLIAATQHDTPRPNASAREVCTGELATPRDVCPVRMHANAARGSRVANRGEEDTAHLGNTRIGTRTDARLQPTCAGGPAGSGAASGPRSGRVLPAQRPDDPESAGSPLCAMTQRWKRWRRAAAS
jgi:hypothetical protein